MKSENEKYKDPLPAPPKGGEPLPPSKSPFKGDLEGRVFYNFSLLIFHLKHPVRKQSHDIGNGTLPNDYSHSVFLSYFPAD